MWFDLSTVPIREASQVPTITRSLPNTQTIADGQSATFECVVEGVPRPSIYWFKESYIIKGSGDFDLSYDEQNCASLTIPEVYPEDAGTYTMVAKNAFGVVSASVQLRVSLPESYTCEMYGRKSRLNSFSEMVTWYGVPPMFGTYPRHVLVDVGECIQIEVSVSGQPRPRVTWLFNGRPIQQLRNELEIRGPAEDALLLGVHRLRVYDATVYNSGVFELLAENSEGRARACVQVTVKREQPPLILERFKGQTVFEKDFAVFVVKFSAHPIPEIKWYHDGLRVYTNEFVRVIRQPTLSRLEIPCARASRDAGEYTVRLWNENGSCQHAASLIVRVPQIEFIHRLSEVEGREGDDALFVVTLSDPNAKVIWKKDYRALRDDTLKYEMLQEGVAHKLLIRSLTIYDEGEYSCTIEDTEQQCFADLVVIESPAEIARPLEDVLVAKGRTARFSVELTKGDALVRWSREDGRELPPTSRLRTRIQGKRHELIIFKSAFEDEGTYMCTVGEQSCTARLTVDAMSVDFSEDIEALETELSIDGKFSFSLTFFRFFHPCLTSNFKINLQKL
jgi:hypothetical protein